MKKIKGQMKKIKGQMKISTTEIRPGNIKDII